MKCLQTVNVSVSRCKVGRRILRHGGRAVVCAVLKEKAQHLRVAVSCREVGDAEAERSHGVYVCTTLYHGAGTGQRVVLSCLVDGRVGEVVFGVEDRAKNARLEGELVERVDKVNDVCQSQLATDAIRNRLL